MATRFQLRSPQSGMLLTTVILAVSLLFAAVYIALQSISLPDVTQTLSGPQDPTHTSKILASDGSIIMSYGRYAWRPVALKEISPHLIEAVIATEDRRFYKHRGLDPQGIARAALTDLHKGGLHQGGSTISQQVARLLFLNNERSWMRKLKEAMLAVRLEKTLSKQDILSLYLNHAYFGEGAYGVEAASRIYFNKPAKTLSYNEAALLAGLIQAPSSYDPFVHPAQAKARRNEVLANLQETRVLKASAVHGLEKQPMKVSKAGRILSNPDKVPYFNRAVLKQAMAQLNVDEQTFWQAGYRIHTTLDPQAQALAEKQVRRLAGRHQAALLSLDSRNRVIAYVGGKDFLGQQFDHVNQAHRQAGSLFKVLVYATAFRQGMTPTTVFDDSAVTVGKWSPHNYDRSTHGQMTLAQALVHSNNVVAVKVMQEVHPESVIETARELGVESKLEPNLSLALGAADVTLQEMTTAFSVFRANGLYRAPVAIESIEDQNGEGLYRSEPEEHTVLDRTTRDTMVAVMRQVVRAGTGRGANLSRRDVAGKTGTSDEYRNAWFIGFTPDVTTGVWIGNDNNSPMPGVTGGSLPAMIWRGYMGAYLAKSKPHNFDLAYAMPLENPNSLVADASSNVDPLGPWADGQAENVEKIEHDVERLTASLENRRHAIRMHTIPVKTYKRINTDEEALAMPAMADAEDVIRHPARRAKHFKRVKKAWKKLKLEVNRIIDEEEDP